jgi:glycerophosphoryl diester phosphodiesterase
MPNRFVPSPEAFGEAWTRLFSPAFAHRGLWSAADGVPENSLAAFQHAAERGYGIELDVRITADGEAVVFHDDTLDRLTGATGRVRDHSVHDLQQLKLNGSDETLPTLAEALTVIGHRSMVLVELKTPNGEVGPLEKRVNEVLIDHHGPVAVIGFNAYSHAWFADHHPQVLRGLNSHAYKEGEGRMSRDAIADLRALKHVSIARPHFLGLGLDMLPSPEADVLRKQGMPVVAWTVRKPDQWDAVKDHCDNLIFEGFQP